MSKRQTKLDELKAKRIKAQQLNLADIKQVATALPLLKTHSKLIQVVEPRVDVLKFNIQDSELWAEKHSTKNDSEYVDLEEKKYIKSINSFRPGIVILMQI